MESGRLPGPVVGSRLTDDRRKRPTSHQDLDSDGERLNGRSAYTVTFPAGELPPVRGFWSLTLYNEHHFFNPNELNRYSLGTKNKTLVTNPDGSLTIHASVEPPHDSPEPDWSPSS